jgi:hypothetical protein
MSSADRSDDVDRITTPQLPAAAARRADLPLTADPAAPAHQAVRQA